MRRTGITLLLSLLVCAPVGAASDADPQPGKQLFETQWGSCHGLELPKSQRLDRFNWKWVIDDMVNEFGATWITEEQQEQILEYLVEAYGPDRPR